MTRRIAAASRALLVAATVALLATCATTQPIRTSLPAAEVAAAQARQLAREAALRGEPDWSLAGRIAVSNGRNGGSGRIDWQQVGPRYEVSLSAPVTRQSWRLAGDAAGARLEGIDGGPREGADAGELLRAATGWDIPVAALAEWVRGVRADGLGPAVVSYGADGRLARLAQGGWEIDYRWPDAAAGAASADAQALPARLDARRGDARVRLIVDAWNPGEP
ncbi:lipoprotein insertase outer membrane protein LolB [Lysobacter koreensis]|uniref:Outer-membrane lipoprotein LolB n=1 Tax=Lysobacter koreensis TaxID=266122 RepID=A0ABW2YTT8_9GAMM